MLPPMRHIGLIALAALLSLPARAEGVLRVTTESFEYCEYLSLRLAGVEARGGDGPAGEASRSMAEEGRRLCQSGHVRAGIAKLRRALRAAQEVRAGD